MATKPTEIIEWAEDPLAQVDEPTAVRARGWPFGYPPPADQFNWWQRAVGRWLRYFESAILDHVHDGGTSDISASKVDLQNHIAWGLAGEMEVTQNDAERHEVTYRHLGAGVSRFVVDELEAGKLIGIFDDGHIRADFISGVKDHILQIWDENDQDNATLRVHRLEANEIGGFQITDAIFPDGITTDFIYTLTPDGEPDGILQILSNDESDTATLRVFRIEASEIGGFQITDATFPNGITTDFIYTLTPDGGPDGILQILSNDESDTATLRVHRIEAAEVGGFQITDAIFPDGITTDFIYTLTPDGGPDGILQILSNDESDTATLRVHRIEAAEIGGFEITDAAFPDGISTDFIDSYSADHVTFRDKDKADNCNVFSRNFHATGAVFTDRIQPPAGNTVEVRNSTGQNQATLDARILRASGSIRSNEVRAISGSTVEILNSDGDRGKIFAGNIEALSIQCSNVLANSYVRSNEIRTRTGSTLSIVDNSGGDNVTAQAKVMRGNDYIAAGQFRPLSGSTCNFRSATGGNATLDSYIFAAGGHLRADQIRAYSGSNSTMKFLRTDGSNSLKIEAHGVQANDKAYIKHIETLGGKWINVRSQGGGNDATMWIGHLHALNAPRCYGKFNGNGQLLKGYSISKNASKTGTGTYKVEFGKPAKSTNDLNPFVTVLGNQAGFGVVEVVDNQTVIVRTYNASGSLRDFSGWVISTLWEGGPNP